MPPPVQAGRIPRLHVITDDAVLARPDMTATACRLLEAMGGGVALHVRGPGATGRALYDVASVLAPVARATGALLVVNDRVDVALATQAAGVHLGARSLGVADARGLLPDGGVIGASVHHGRDAAGAAGQGADWIFMGTVFPTPSHPDRPGAGLPSLTAAVRSAAGVPVLAIGGVTVGRVAEVAGTGARGVAVIRGVWDAPDPVEAAGDYLQEWAATAAVKPQEGA